MKRSSSARAHALERTCGRTAFELGCILPVRRRALRPAGCYVSFRMAAFARSTSDSRPPLVLVVDDYPDTRDMYAEYLDFAGMRAETAENGRQAVRRALRAHPDAIVMDLAMPVLDGWEATRILHADPWTKDIPIVVLTGTSQPDQKKRAEECGAMLVLQKPCSPSDLCDVLRDLLEKSAASTRTPKAR